MKKTAIILACALSALSMSATDADGKPVLLLTGASFAVPENGWFEIGCEDMGVTPMNKAVSGEAIYHTARRMNSGTFYTIAELDQIDVFVIGHVHNQNVANEQWIKENWEDYQNIATTTDYAVTYDYVIKRYIADCKALKDNPDSRYYGSEEGKPVKIILCTHWHDSRTTYNPAIRKLAERWGFPLVEFDTNIGFSKDDVAAGEPQPSIAMAHDTEKINGVTYGWHPLRGSNSHIQQRMAQIFESVAAPVLGIEVPFECTLTALSPLVGTGEHAAVLATFRSGHYPFTLKASAGNDEVNHDTFKDAALIMEAPATKTGTGFAVNTLSDANGTEASLPAEVSVRVADVTIAPSYDAYIHEAYKENSYTTQETLQLKNGDNWSRKIYLTFPTANLDPEADKIVVRMFFDSYVLGTLSGEKRSLDGFETLELSGNTSTYGANLKWNGASSHQFEPIAETLLSSSMVQKWIGWDVTDWVKSKLAEGAQNVTFRVSTPYRWRSLTNFVATEHATTPHLAPQMLLALPIQTGVESIRSESSLSFKGGAIYNPAGLAVRIFAADGRIVYAGCEEMIATDSLAPALYIASAGGETLKFIR